MEEGATESQESDQHLSYDNESDQNDDLIDKSSSNQKQFKASSVSSGASKQSSEFDNESAADCMNIDDAEDIEIVEED